MSIVEQVAREGIRILLKNTDNFKSSWGAIQWVCQNNEDIRWVNISSGLWKPNYKSETMTSLELLHAMNALVFYRFSDSFCKKYSIEPLAILDILCD